MTATALSLLKQLRNHLEWADRRVLDALQTVAAPGRALELFAHVLGAEHVWLSRIRGRAPSYAVWPNLSREQCAALAAENASGYSALLEELEEPALLEPVDYVNSAGHALRSRLDEMLLQVFTHGCYHRGQVALLLREAGLAPPGTDFITLVRGVPAASRVTS